MLLGCKYGDDYQCHFVKGSEICNRRKENIAESLKRLGVEPERVEQYQVAIDEYDKIPGMGWMLPTGMGAGVNKIGATAPKVLRRSPTGTSRSSPKKKQTLSKGTPSPWRAMGIKLQVTDAALSSIAEAAAKNSRIGARALREIFNGLIATHGQVLQGLSSPRAQANHRL